MSDNKPVKQPPKHLVRSFKESYEPVIWGIEILIMILALISYLSGLGILHPFNIILVTLFCVFLFFLMLGRLHYTAENPTPTLSEQINNAKKQAVLGKRESKMLLPKHFGKESKQKRQYKIEQLKELIKEYERIHAEQGITAISRLMLTRPRFNERAETFLTTFFDESYVEAFREQGIDALYEFLNELLD